MDPSVSATLPLSLVAEQREKRAMFWAELRSQRQQEYAALENQLAHLRDTFARDTASAREIVARSDAVIGWSADDQQQRLRHVVASYRNHGQKYAQLLDRLRIEFASEARMLLAKASAANNASSKAPLSLALAERVELLEKARLLSLQRSALLAAFEAERQPRLEAATLALQESDRSAVANFQRAQEAQALAEQQAALHAELDVLRADKAERKAAEAEEERQRAEAQAVEDAARAAREQQVREQQKQLLALYHAHAAAEAAEALRAQERQRAREAEQARAALEAARPNIERRQELLVARRQAQQQREAEERQAAREREARLEALRALVITTAERDPERLLAATAASSADDSLAQHPLFAVHGYDMSALLKDQRFRIQLALWNAGVHQSEYARAVVAAAPTATQPRPDMKSNVFGSS
jgi:hypothetical protein